MSLEIRLAYNEGEKVKVLFSEYTQMLLQKDCKFKSYLEIQNYDDEISNLEDKYGLPYGRLYIALVDDKPAGCIALRKLDEKRSELKRLYIRPEFRGEKIAKSLMELIIKDAKEIGYSCILLDTISFMKEAINMYKNFGFREIPPYNNSPVEGTVFFQLDL